MKTERAHDAPPPLRCPFCREGFDHTAPSIACGSCLATHHGGCWEEGGWCCAVCGAERWLELGAARSKPTRPPTPRPPADRLAWILRVAAVALGCAVVTLQCTRPVPAAPAVAELPLAEKVRQEWPDPEPDPEPEPEVEKVTRPPAPVENPYEEAQLALDRREWALALAVLDELIPVTADPNPLLVASAQALHELGQHERALDFLNRAISARPNRHAWRLQRADLLLSLGRLPEALDDYRAVLKSSKKPDPRLELLIAALEELLPGYYSVGKGPGMRLVPRSNPRRNELVCPGPNHRIRQAAETLEESGRLNPLFALKQGWRTQLRALVVW